MKCAATLALLALSALAAADSNAVRNPSFENGLDSWDTAGGPEGIAIDTSVAHLGKQSVRLFGATSGVHQAFGFAETFQHPVRVSGWSRTQAVEAEAFAIWVTGEYADGTKIEREGEDFQSGTHDWQRVEFIFEPRKPVKSLELLAVLVNGKGTAWLDDLEMTLAPFAFRGITIDPNVGVVGGLTVRAPWKAELRGAPGVVASAAGEGPPVQLHWSAPRGNYTLHFSAVDALRGESIEETRSFKISGPRSLSMWVESSMRRVLPQALPGTSQAARIALAGNEYESFQLCLLAPKAIKGVRLELSELVANGGKRIPSSELAWQQVGYVRIDTLRKSKANESAFAGWWPDPLLPVESFDLQPGFTQPVWITVHAPAGTPPGEYRGAVRVIADGQPPLIVPLHATVYGFSLPSASHLKTAFALLGEELDWLYGKPRSAQLRQSFGDFLLRHRLNADDIYRKEIPDADDLRHYRERGLNAFNLLYLIPEKGALIPELSAYTPELLRTLLERLSHAPAGENAYVYGFDESDPEFFSVMREYFGEIKRAHPDLHTMTTAHIPLDPKVLKSLNVDWIVPLTPNYDFAKAEECRRAGLEVWSYVAVGPREPYANFLADDPLIEARILGWQAYRQKLDGLLYWGVNIWERRGNRSPIDLSRGPLLEWRITTGKENDERWLRELHGDGLLLYPTANGPIGSIRLANLRDGLEDYEYLWMTGNREAGAAVTRDLTHFTLDPAVVLATRDRLARALVRR